MKPQDLSPEAALEQFEYWLADMDDALERFFATVPLQLATRLDYSPRSLESLEAWILERSPSPQAMLAPSEVHILDGLSRYIGQTFRRALGGRWNILCPITLATASADRRNGQFIAGVLAACVRRQARPLG